MKGKTLLSLATVLSILLAMTPLMPLMSAHASPGATLSIVPAVVGNVTKGSTFDVTVHIAGVPTTPATAKLWSWSISIEWTAGILNCTNVAEGTFLASQAGPTFYLASPPDNVAGKVAQITDTSMKVPPTGAGGEGDLCVLTFQVLVSVGTTPITIDPDLMAVDKTHITVDAVINGMFVNPPKPPTKPQAYFTPPSCTTVYVGTNVTLDATASTAGFDTLPAPGTDCPITDYAWKVDLLNGTVLALDGEIVAFLCTKPGDVVITLTVTAPDPVPPSHPDYVNVSSVAHTIHQISRPMGVVIDVYTQKGGQGLGINWDATPPVQWPWPTDWSDAFAPQEEVTVYAKVTYNDDPVQNKPVAFEVKDETGVAVLYRTAFTDANGIATITFRMIWECNKTFTTNYEVWEIYASVSVSQIDKYDVCKFRYGWLVQIEEIDAPSQVNKGSYFDVTLLLKNLIHWPSNNKAVYVTVVLYDVCGVPVAVGKVPNLMVPEDAYMWDPTFTLYVPKWTYRGTGVIYANIFTNAPQAGGVPVCPESSASIWLGRP
jgi:hypothetical protein